MPNGGLDPHEDCIAYPCDFCLKEQEARKKDVVGQLQAELRATLTDLALERERIEKGIKRLSQEQQRAKKAERELDKAQAENKKLRDLLTRLKATSEPVFAAYQIVKATLAEEDDG